MTVRALLVCCIFGAAVFGQLPVTVKAGDPAPPLSFSKIVESGSGLGGPQSLFGQVTVLNFLPPVSVNADAVARWNELVERFADRPVNFVWIAAEGEDELLIYLKTHPVKGWLVLDPGKESYKAYGIEGGGAVFIDARAVIAGFTQFADEREIQAVLDGRAIAITGEPTAAQKAALFQGNSIRLEAEPYRMPPPPQKPDLPPSEEVYISPSTANGTIASSGPDHWMQRGFDLKSILATIMETDPSRVELAESIDGTARWDFVLIPPKEEDTERMYTQVREGIERHFHVAVTRQIRSRDVYVMTAIEGKTPPAKPEGDLGGGFISTAGTPRTIEVPDGASPEALQALAKELEDDAILQEISASGADMDQLRQILERSLKRPVIDETGLKGSYDFSVKGSPRTTEDFLRMLRDQTGLVLTPTQRSIEVVAVTPSH